MTQSLTCKACHKAKDKSVAPSYLDIGKKYIDQDGAISYLQGKIKSGGSGVWGQVSMPANPDLKADETNKIAQYILSLADENNIKKTLPAEGTIIPESGNDQKTMVITASYTDRGALGSGPLTGIKRIGIPGSVVSMTKAQDLSGFNPISFGAMNLLISPRDGGSFAISNVDLTGVKSINITAGWQSAPKKGYKLIARLNSLDGELIGTGTMPTPTKGSPGGLITIKLNKAIAQKVDKIFFEYAPTESEKLAEDETMALSGLSFGID